MKFALLGADETAIALIQIALHDDAHDLVAAFGSESQADVIRQLAPQVRCTDGWESLLHGSDADAVIVARDSDGELLIEQLRRLVQAAVPLIVIHPICEMISAFELQMIQQDTNCVILPHVPGIHHPAIRQLREWISSSDSPLGNIQQVTIQRCLREISKRSVDDQLARDAMLVCQLLGPVQCVSAIAGGVSNEHGPTANVQMSSESGIVASWSALHSIDESKSELIVLGVDATAKIAMPADSADWRLSVVDREFDPGDFPNVNWHQAALDQLALAMAGRPNSPAWSDACQALEIADAAQISAGRGKTVNLHHEELSEEKTFKSMMAAGGCLALTLVLLLLPALAVVDSLSRPLRRADNATPGQLQAGADSQPRAGGSDSPFLSKESPVATQRRWFSLHNWPYPLLALLAIFLGLQLLRLVFATGPENSDANRT